MPTAPRSPLRIAAVAALFSLTACGGGGSDTSAAATAAPTAAPAPAPAAAPSPSPAPAPAAPTPAPAPAPATLSASGSVTASGAAPGSLAPQTDGFKVETEASGTTYTFLRKNVVVTGTNALYTANVKVTKKLNGNIEVVYFNPTAPGASAYFCSPCSGVTVTPAAGAEHPVTVAFAGAVLGTVTLDGSLVGDASDAAWNPRELPRSTTGALAVSGTSTGVVTATIATTAAAGNGSIRTVTVTLDDGRSLGYSESLDAGGALLSSGVTFIGTTVASFQSCNTNCSVSVNETASGGSVTFAGTTLSGGATFTGTVAFSKPQGTLTSPTLGAITPVHDAVTSDNDKRTYVFDVLGTPAQAGISLVSVTFRGNVATEMAVTTGIAATVYHCFETASTQPLVPACAGIARAADLRTFTFTNVALQGGGVGVSTAVSFSGTLVARGL